MYLLACIYSSAKSCLIFYLTYLPLTKLARMQPHQQVLHTSRPLGALSQVGSWTDGSTIKGKWVHGKKRPKQTRRDCPAMSCLSSSLGKGCGFSVTIPRRGSQRSYCRNGTARMSYLDQMKGCLHCEARKGLNMASDKHGVSPNSDPLSVPTHRQTNSQWW